MADNRKYYYLKLKEDFFDTDEMKILESMKDGYLYSNILLKLYLKSLSNSGRLMYRNVIPYTPEILATLTGQDRKSTRLNSSHTRPSRMPSSA